LAIVIAPSLRYAAADCPAQHARPISSPIGDYRRPLHTAWRSRLVVRAAASPIPQPGCRSSAERRSAEAWAAAGTQQPREIRERAPGDLKETLRAHPGIGALGFASGSLQPPLIKAPGERAIPAD